MRGIASVCDNQLHRLDVGLASGICFPELVIKPEAAWMDRKRDGISDPLARSGQIGKVCLCSPEIDQTGNQKKQR